MAGVTEAEEVVPVKTGVGAVAVVEKVALLEVVVELSVCLQA